MIEFSRTNQKGQSLTGYTHKNYLSKHYNEQIIKTQVGNKSLSTSIFFGTSIAAYYAIAQIPAIHSVVQKKLSIRAKFLVVPVGLGLFTSFFVSYISSISLKSKHQSLLKNQTFPIWFKKERVVNPDRIFFELDDHRHFQPNIYHSGITLSAIQNLHPDAIVGSPVKPHKPSADHHAHH